MIRAQIIRAAGSWSGAPADSVVLDYDDRFRRRIAMRGVRGTEFLLDLPEAIALRGGDGLVLDDERIVEVVAAPESLAEIRCADDASLLRIAWHLGNRHLPTQIMARRLRIRRDPIIEDMVRRLGASVADIEAPFDPEGGAYNSSNAHGPDAIEGARHAHDHGVHVRHGN
jgi:urease accessory protein